MSRIARVAKESWGANGRSRGRAAPLPPPADAGTRARRAERGLIVLVALHSFAVGAVLVLFPRAAVSFGGFAEPTSSFFPRQAGVFHLALAFGYLLEHFRYRGIALLLFAKGAAGVLLLSTAAAGDAPWAVPFSGLADVLMGAAAWVLHRKAAVTPPAG